MDQELAEFQSLISWFCNLEEIPLQTRHDFLAHVLKVGKFDDKAKNFMEDALNNIENKNKKALAEDEALLAQIESILERQKSDQSLENAIVTSSEEEMMRLAVDFKEDYRAYEHEQTTHQESQEKTEEVSVIAALKASL